MSYDEIPHELNRVTGALEDWHAPTITGSQLFALIRSAAPNLDVRAYVGIPKGPGALTEFARRYLSEVVERIGNQGGDVLYGIRGKEAVALQPSGVAQVWRTFVSPNSPQHLVLSRSAGRLVARDTPASSAEDELEVAKASLEEHDGIRAAFMASLPEPELAVLGNHVAADAEFRSWITALRQHLPNTFREWGVYRRRRLSELFAARIDGLGLDDPLRRAALEQIRISERSAYAIAKDGNFGISKQGARPTIVGDDATDATSRARQLAHAAIDRMAYDDLRALRIPLGAMLDAI
jgi:hypothetical protein